VVKGDCFETKSRRVAAGREYDPASRLRHASHQASGEHLLKNVLHPTAGRELFQHGVFGRQPAGAGLYAAFDGPARAIHCAIAIRDGVRSFGLDVRAGVHTDECKVIGEKLGGIAVHIGARVAGMSRPGEVLVTSTVKDLVAGSGVTFDGRGARTLRGLPGEWHLFAVTSV
jgi:class 3 adenylate cyclase